MKKLIKPTIFTVILGLFLNSAVSQAAPQQMISQQMPTAEGLNDYIYNMTLKMCTNPKLSDSSTHALSAASDFLGVFTSNSIQSQIDSFSIVPISPLMGWSNYLKTLYSSPGFYQALDDCFGSNKTSRQIFITKLTYVDLVGKLVGAVGFYEFITVAIGLPFSAVRDLFYRFHWVAGKAFDIGNIGMIVKIFGEFGYRYYKKIQTGIDPVEAENNPVLKQVLDEFNEGKITKEQIGFRVLELTMEQYSKMVDDLSKAQEAELEEQLKTAKSDQERTAIQQGLDEIRKARQKREKKE
ncbi:MAG: hypothetical protein AB7F43_10505 [Bacteriovoracia bacterium]